MLRSRKIIASLFLFLLMVIIRFTPTYLNKWGLIPDIDVKYFENPAELEINNVIEGPRGKATIVLNKEYEIPYQNETVILSGFSDNYYNQSTTVNVDKANHLKYHTDLDYKASNSDLSGNLYWEGAGGFFSYMVLLLGYVIPFIISIIWFINFNHKTSKAHKYMAYISLWLTGTYVFNMLVFHNTKFIAYSFSITALAILLAIKYLPTIWNTFVPNYKTLFEDERIYRLLEESERRRLEKMINGWTTKELKSLEWALFNMQFVPEIIHKAKDPNSFKRILFEHISNAHQELKEIKERINTVNQ